MKKPITELSEEELLDLIKDEPNSIKVYEWSNDVMDFISVYNLKSGQEKITYRLLYKLYKLWSNYPINRRLFVTTLRDIFPSDYTYIFLDKTILNIKEEAYNYLKKQDKTHSKKWLDHFNQYLQIYSIKKGGLYIKDKVLYNLYDKWCYKKDRKHNPLSLLQFVNFCRLHFKTKRIINTYWFKVDESIQQHLNENLIKEMSKSRAPKKEIKKI